MYLLYGILHVVIISARHTCVCVCVGVNRLDYTCIWLG